MKKLFTLALLMMLVAIVALPLSGCGGDTEQARQYMQQGDELAGQFRDEANTWVQNIKSGYESQAGQEKFRASAKDLSETAGEAKATFEKILSLEGVEGYAKYADLQIQRMEIFQEFITRTSTYFDEVVAMMDSGDVSNLQSLTDEYLEDADKLGEEIDGLDEEAQKLKADKNL